MSKNTAKYTSPVTEEYEQATDGTTVRYTIEENFNKYPDVKNRFKEWQDEQDVIELVSFNGVFAQAPSMFDIRKAEIREDWGQRNCLTERGRIAKILGMAKFFDVKLFEPISIDCFEEDGEKRYIIRDGGGRSHAAWLNQVYTVPATVRYVDSYEESRRLFMDQDKFNATISTYDKFLQQLNDPSHNYHKVACDVWKLAKTSGFCLHWSNKSTETPLVEGISVLQRTIRKSGGDDESVKWGARTAPNVTKSIDVFRHVFPNNDEIPVSVLEAFTAFIHITHKCIPPGERGLNRLKAFAVAIRDSDEELGNIKNWTKKLQFDSSNSYAEYGAAAFMRKWNEVHTNKPRKGKKGVWGWVKWTDSEINSTREYFEVKAPKDDLVG